MACGTVITLLTGLYIGYLKGGEVSHCFTKSDVLFWMSSEHGGGISLENSCIYELSSM